MVNRLRDDRLDGVDAFSIRLSSIRRRRMINRLEGIAWLGLAGLSLLSEPVLPISALAPAETTGGWRKIPDNPVLGMV
jgi:hypothetical protein